jgi:hypothetical protein
VIKFKKFSEVAAASLFMYKGNVFLKANDGLTSMNVKTGQLVRFDQSAIVDIPSSANLTIKG